MKRGQFLTRQQIELAETFTKALLLSGRSGLAVAGDGAVDEIITLVVDGSDRRGGGHIARISSVNMAGLPKFFIDRMSLYT